MVAVPASSSQQMGCSHMLLTQQASTAWQSDMIKPVHVAGSSAVLTLLGGALRYSFSASDSGV